MPVQRFFEAPDGTFSYLDWGGDGPLTHIAHATGFCAGVYDPLAQMLATRLGVVGMDNRGHGRTSAPADPKNLRSWNTFADDLGFFFNRLKAPVISIGHSLGAVSSMMLAARQPQLIKALILIDPTIMSQSLNLLLFISQRLGFTKIFPIVSGAARRKPVWPDRSTIQEAYSKRVPFNKWTDGFLKGYLDYGFEEIESGSLKLRCQPAWESRCFSTCPAAVWKIPAQLKMPVLIIYGSSSDVFVSKCALKFKKECPMVELKRMEGTGHFVPMEQPQQTAKSVFEFLEKLKIL